MTLIASQAMAHVEHALAGGLGDGLSALGVVNEAGELMYAMKRWRFLEQPPATLDLVSGQAYVALPSDFGEMVAYDATNSLVNSLHMTTHQHLLELRTNQIQATSWNFWASIVWQAGTDGELDPRLEFWPTPSASDTGALTIMYRKRWVNVTQDNDTIEIPSWAHSLFIGIVRAVAQGYEEADAGSLDARLAEIKAGPRYEAACMQDGATQTHYGLMEGGAAQQGGYVRSWDFTAANPA